MHIGSENNYSFLFIANLSLCVSLSPWKVWIQGLGDLGKVDQMSYSYQEPVSW